MKEVKIKIYIQTEVLDIIKEAGAVTPEEEQNFLDWYLEDKLQYFPDSEDVSLWIRDAKGEGIWEEVLGKK
jgi:hypothetical protein